MLIGHTHNLLLIRYAYLCLHKQECYTLLQKHSITVSRDEVERVDTLRYLWQNLRQLVSETLSHLLVIQPKFKSSLVENVKQYQETVGTFVDDYSKVCVTESHERSKLCVYVLNTAYNPLSTERSNGDGNSTT